MDIIQANVIFTTMEYELANTAAKYTQLNGQTPQFGCCMIQGSLLAELDLLAWQLRLRDGAEAAMPRSLKRQLMKSSRKAVVKALQPGQLPATGEESLVSSDSESKDPAGRFQHGQHLTSQFLKLSFQSSKLDTSSTALPKGRCSKTSAWERKITVLNLLTSSEDSSSAVCNG